MFVSTLIYFQAVRKHNDLKRYRKRWPVHDLIKSYLHYYNGKSRRLRVLKEAKEAREAKEAKEARREVGTEQLCTTLDLTYSHNSAETQPTSFPPYCPAQRVA